ncbi:protein kinase [Actinomadura sp. 9N407]|uniref:protein kinase domain-containing protein n=1 Tax=Actinomadura sp. 9N407 TaxID=3375154 RepID=UPI0037A9BC0E
MSTWRLDGFTEVGELGSGAQGRVVLARRGDSDAFVAIKYVTGDRTRVPAQHEARLMASVDDEHVARLYELVERPDGVAMVMEAVEGVSLKRLLHAHRTLEPEAALRVLKGSLLGLAAAHAVGVVHRDYKPANVIVQADGTSKLIDFGTATMMGHRSLSGTPAYMAPEQWNGDPATPATDVYAATCVFYECVAGRPPYGGDNDMVLMAQHATAAPPISGVPEPLRGLVAHGMAKDPALRPGDAAEFVRELEEAARAAYGEDWERRGLLFLASAAGALAAMFPQVVATGTAGSAIAGSAIGGSAIGHSSLGASVVRGGRHAGKLSRLQVFGTVAVASAVVVGAATLALVFTNATDKEPIALAKPQPSAAPSVPPADTPTPEPSEPPADPSPAVETPSPAPSTPATPGTSGTPAPGTAGPVDGPGPVSPPEPSPAPTVAGPTTAPPTTAPPTTAPPTTEPPPPACPRVTQAAQAFGPVDVGGTATRDIPIEWNGCYDASAIRIDGAAAFRSSTTCPPASGTACTVTVTYNPTNTTSDTGTLIVPDQDGEAAVTVPLTGTAVAADCFPYQQAHDLGEVVVGRTAEGAFTYPWRVCDDEQNMRVVGGEGQFAVTLTACPPASDGGPCGFTVRFTPRSAGPQTATMVIMSDEGGRAVDITLTGTGVGAGTEAPAPESTGTADSEPESTTPKPTPTPSEKPKDPEPEPSGPKPQPEPSKPEPSGQATTPPPSVPEQAPQAKASPTAT